MYLAFCLDAGIDFIDVHDAVCLFDRKLGASGSDLTPVAKTTWISISPPTGHQFAKMPVGAVTVDGARVVFRQEGLGQEIRALAPLGRTVTVCVCGKIGLLNPGVENRRYCAREMVEGNDWVVLKRE